MCAHYLARKGSGWVFQIRVPTDLAFDSTLAPIRIPLGAKTAREAGKHAVLMAAAAQIAFRKVRSMQSDIANGLGMAKVSSR